jgi:hypothetical protein
MGQYKPPEVLAMFDIESLDVGPRSIITQIGMALAPADDPETILYANNWHLPINPQVAVHKRTFNADTLIWWMTDSSITQSVRDEIKLSSGDDYEELPALLRAMTRKFDQVVDGRQVECWSRGNFDAINIESLLDDCAIDKPWRYDAWRDLRTLMAAAQIGTSDVIRDLEKFPLHNAIADCGYQMLCYTESLKALARNK